MPVIYVCTLTGYNFKMHSEPALCRKVCSLDTELFIHSPWPSLRNCSFKSLHYKQQFINNDMSIDAPSDTGPILLKILRKCRVCYHWKEILINNENVNPPPAVNLNDTNVFVPKSLKTKMVY